MDETKINTSNWTEAIYIVCAKIGEDIFSEKLRVKHQAFKEFHPSVGGWNSFFNRLSIPSQMSSILAID